jgi:hypothetical protein
MSGVLGALVGSFAPVPGAYEQIATLSGTGSSDSITFSSIPQTYTHLQIRGTGSASYGSTQDYGNAGLRFNGDTGNNYTYHILRGYHDGTTAYTQTGGSGTFSYGLVGIAHLSPSMNSLSAGMIFDILDYTNTNKTKTMKCLSGVDGLRNTSAGLQLGSSVWKNTSAINSITIYQSNGSWFSNTKFSLYGIKS